MELSKELKMNDIPILIPIKGISKRCPDKNRKLLPFTIKFITDQNCTNNTFVISDSSDLLKLAKSYGLNTYLEVREEGQDELISCYNFIKNYQYDVFVLLPVTQPFRDKYLLQKCCSLYRKTINEEIDFITSFTEVSNRERFYLDFKNDIPTFKNGHTVRKGESCSSITMIDGAIYMIKTDFIRKTALSQNTNCSFWNGRFRCVYNKAPFMDVDIESDMENIELLRYYYETSMLYLTLKRMKI